jgi:hypothetical protein
MVKEKTWKEVVSLKRMLITPEKCKYNIYFGKENKKKVLTLLLHALARASPLQPTMLEKTQTASVARI